MEDMLLYVHYNWTGNDIEEISKYHPGYRKKANDHFKKIRHKACVALNSKIDEWNKEFDKMYPDIVEDRYDPNSECMKYICKKENEVLSKIHNTWYKLHSDKNGEIVGDLLFTDSSVYMTFVTENDD